MRRHLRTANPRLGLEALEAREVPAVVGAFDPSFSGDGVTDVVTGTELNGVARQQDGKLVAVGGTTTGDFFFIRYNPDGSIDSTFGNNGTGKVTVDVGGLDRANEVAVDAQNRIVAVGIGGTPEGDFALVRLSADGKTVELNKSYQVGDVAASSTATGVDFQTDGTIVVGGHGQFAANRDFALIRVSPSDGALVGTVQNVSFTAGADLAFDVTVYKTGPNQNKIVLVGSTAAGDFGIVQRLADGATDTTFNGTGSKTIDVSGTDAGRGVAITPTGAVVVVGNNGAADTDAVVTVLLPTGAFDPAFNGGAVLTIPRAGTDVAIEVATQADGRIVVVGDSNGGVDIGVTRLNPNGSFDTSFATGGTGVYNVGGNDDGNGVLIDPNGRIVVAADNTTSGFLLRLIGGVEQAPVLSVGGSLDGQAVLFTPTPLTGQFPTTPSATVTGFSGSSANVRSAVADVNGDRIPDTILVNGPGPQTRFVVVSGADNTTVLVSAAAPFAGSETFTGGAFVTAADIDNDGLAEFVFTPDQGGGPRVTIFSLVNGAAVVRANFFGIDDPGFRGGARAGAGDVDGDGFADLAVAAGFQGGPRVALFDGETIFQTTGRLKLVNDFFVFPDQLRNGVYVAIGDVNADGFGDLLIGAGPGGGPVLKIISGQLLVTQGSVAAQTDANKLAEFFVGGSDSDRSGVRVTAVDADGDNRADVAVGSGGSRPARVRVYLGKDLTSKSEPATSQDLTVFNGASLTDGIFVG